MEYWVVVFLTNGFRVVRCESESEASSVLRTVKKMLTDGSPVQFSLDSGDSLVEVMNPEFITHAKLFYDRQHMEAYIRLAFRGVRNEEEQQDDADWWRNGGQSPY